MEANAILLQKPAGTPEELFLLFHGVGADADDMVPLGHFLGNLFPRAAVISVDGHEPSDISAGRQWFSVRGITEENRVERVAAALPDFLAAIRHWQEQTGVDAARTTLVGFSQGGIMALATTQLPAPAAGRVVALSSRFATLPEQRPNARIHLLHGDSDGVIACSHMLNAAARLHRLNAGATADLIPGAEHEITGEMLQKLAAHLTRRN
ncbi:MAG: esterase [Pseudomonadota bacterium]